MRRWLFIFLLLVPSLSLRGQEPSSQQLKEKILSCCAEAVALDCDFVQTRESSLLAEKAVSKGRMRYRRPAYLKWEYAQPFSLCFVSDGSGLTMEKDGRKVPLEGGQERFAREMTRLILSSVEGNFLLDETLFRSEASLDGDRIRVVLHPQKKDLRKRWSQLVLLYDQTTMTASRFEMLEPSGDRTVIVFHARENTLK